MATFRYKLRALVASAVIGGVGGSVFALQIGFVAVESVFSLTVPLFVIVMSVLGGRTHWAGPVLGAVLIVLLQDRLTASGLDSWRLIVLGAVLAVLVVVAPEGLVIRRTGPPVAGTGRVRRPAALLWLVRPCGEPLDWILVGMLVARPSQCGHAASPLVRSPVGRARPAAGSGRRARGHRAGAAERVLD